MNIVEPTTDDMTMDQVVVITGLSSKTLRRAVQKGELARRYMLGSRGPQLVFARAELELWQHRSRGSARRRPALESRVIGATLAPLAQLQRLMDENGAVMERLLAQLDQQTKVLLEAQATMDQIRRSLAALSGDAGVDAAGPSDTSDG